MMVDFVFGGILGLALGLVLGVLGGFDWQAYFNYKTKMTEIVMKYKKEGKE